MNSFTKQLDYTWQMEQREQALAAARKAAEKRGGRTKTIQIDHKTWEEVMVEE